MVGATTCRPQMHGRANCGLLIRITESLTAEGKPFKVSLEKRIQMRMRSNRISYKIVLEPDPEDGGYVVHCPASPGCYSQGETKKEAIENIREAIEAYVESLKKDQLPTPKAAEPEIVSVTVHPKRPEDAQSPLDIK